MRSAIADSLASEAMALNGNMTGTHRSHKTSALRIAIGIATRGRPSVLRDTLQHLNEQSSAPDSIIVAYTGPQDIGDLQVVFPQVRFLQSSSGLTRQRNTILRALPDEDIILFLDDDFYLHSSYVSRILDIFTTHSDVVVATGHVVADGINSAGLTFEDAQAVLGVDTAMIRPRQVLNVFNAYGCNMALRLTPIREHHLSFDEALPLYGWYEDVDFSRQLSIYGRVVKISDAYGVHLGVKGGRQSGVRLGYSQVANPLYLARKRSVSWSYAISSMVSRSAKNLVKCLNPEPFVDRKGRLQGNLKAWRDLLDNEIHPTRIQDL
ncbi:MAG: glycosyltransferase [Acidobacteria bacterium]|nr:glycosyltransferase [Acidobacteriota bacterium]